MDEATIIGIDRQNSVPVVVSLDRDAPNSLASDFIMTITIPETVFRGFAQWMFRSDLWPRHLAEAVHDHLHAYCDEHDLDTFDELADKIGDHAMRTLRDIAMNDFLSRETEDGNAVDHYLNKRGWKETRLIKAYMRGKRNSVMSLREITDIQPGVSFMARDLILGGEPVLVTERTATKTVSEGEHLAIRLAEVRGQHLIAGGILPYKPELSEQLVQAIVLCAGEITGPTVDLLASGNEPVEPAILRDLSLSLALKMTAPVFSQAWLADAVPGPEDIMTLALKRLARAGA